MKDIEDCKIERSCAALVGGQTVSMSMTINDRVKMFLWKEKISVNAIILYLNAVKSK